MKNLLLFALFLLGTLSVGNWARADEGLDAKTQAKIDAWKSHAEKWAADPSLVKAVETQNASLPAGFAEMTQEKWAALPDLHPFVRALATNPVAQWLRTQQTEAISEAFLSDANGFKVALLAKTTNWCHKGKPKHDVPMSGKTWQGKVEIDQSTETRQLQISVPVRNAAGQPIGSLVLGLSLSALVSE